MQVALATNLEQSQRRCDASCDRLREENSLLRRRLEVLTGVGGHKSTLVRQGKKIQRLTQANAKLEKENKDLSRLLRKTADQSETILQNESRIEHLEQENGKLQARLNRSNHKQYGKSTERKGSGAPSKPKRKRGAQVGDKGHGRTNREQLPEVIEHTEPAEEVRCEHCGESYGYHGTVESHRIEIEVKTYKRVIRRPRWRQRCCCSGCAKTVTSDGEAFLIKGGEYGDSVWQHALLSRYGMNLTLGNVSRWFESAGLEISKGTLLHHDKKFLEWFKPLYEAIGEHQRQGSVWYMDETSWPVAPDGSSYQKHWCWVGATKDSVRFLIDPTRSAQAGLKLMKDFDDGYLMCDRYSSYNAIAKQLEITLAVCWSHARRDFVDVERGGQYEQWVDDWLGRVSKMYKIEAARKEHFDEQLAVDEQSKAFEAEHRRLHKHVNRMFKVAHNELNKLGANSAKRKALERLVKYESGLRVFVEYPWVEPDNNRSERALRWMVIYRKLSHGSKSLESAELTAVMHSVFETLALNGVSVRQWLEWYLRACAEAGGVPDDIDRFLPWSQPP